MMNNFGAGFVLTAQDQASPVMNAFSQNIGSLKERLMGVGMAAVAMGQKLSGAGAAMRAAFGAAMEAQGAFGSATREVYTIADQSQFSLERIQKTVNELSKEFGSPAPLVARAMYQTFSSGIMDATQAVDALRVANKLAVGGATDVETALDGLTSVMNAFSSQGVTAAQVSDDMFIAIKAGKTTAEELSSYLGRVSPSAASLGVKFKELAGALATITIQGISTAAAASGLAGAFANIQKPSADATAEAKRLGVEFSAAAMRAKGLKAFINDITKSAGYNADSMSKLFGSIEAFKVMTALATEGGKKFNAIMGDMENSTGATEAAFEIMEGSYGRMIQKNDAVVESIKRTFGADLQGLMTPFVIIIGNITRGFDDLTAAIPPEARKVILTFLSAFATLVASVGGVIALVGAMNLFGITLKAVVYSALSFVAVIVPLTVLLAGFGVAAYAMYKGFSDNVEGVGDTWEETMRKLKLGWSATIELIQNGELSDAMKTELGKAENEGVGGFVEGVGNLLDRLRGFWDGLKTGFGEAVRALGPQFSELKTQLGGLINLFSGDNTPQKLQQWRDAGSRAGQSLGQLGSLGIKAFQTILPYADRFLTWLGALTAQDIEGYVSGFVTGFNKIKTVVMTITDLIMSFINAVKAIGYTLMGIGGFVGDFMKNLYYVGDYAQNMVMAGITPGDTNYNQAQNAMKNAGYETTLDMFGAAGNSIFGSGTFDENRSDRKIASVFDPAGGSVSENVVGALTAKLKNYQDWISTPQADWKATGHTTPYAFEGAPGWMQVEQVNNMNRLIEALNKVAKKELVARVDIETLRSSVGKGEQLSAGRDVLPSAEEGF